MSTFSLFGDTNSSQLDSVVNESKECSRLATNATVSTPPPKVTSKILPTLHSDDSESDDDDALQQASTTARAVFDFALQSPNETLPPKALFGDGATLPSFTLQASSFSSTSGTGTSLLKSAYVLALSSWKVCVPICMAWRGALKDPRVAHIALSKISNSAMSDVLVGLEKQRTELVKFVEHDLTESLGDWVSFYMLCIPEPYCFLPRLTTLSSPVEFGKTVFEFLARSDGGADCITNFFNRLSNGEYGPFWHDVELPEHLRVFLELMQPVCLGIVETFLLIKAVAAVNFEAVLRRSSFIASDIECLRMLREHVYLAMFAFRVVSVAWYVLFLAVMGPVRNALVASARETSRSPSRSGSRLQRAHLSLERTTEPALVSVDDFDIGRSHGESAVGRPIRRRSFSDFHSDDPSLKTDEGEGDFGPDSCHMQ